MKLPHTKADHASTLATVAVGLSMCVALSVQAQSDSFVLSDSKMQTPTLYTSAIEVGAGYQSDDSFYIGRYGGVTESGPFLVLNGTLDGGDPWDSGDGTFWDAAFDIRGFDMLSLYGRYGTQGRWSLSAFYESFVRSYTETAQTPFNGAGGASLILPDDWRSNISSTGFSTLEDSLKPLELKVKWRTVGGDFVYIPADGYEMRFQFSDRNRKGTRGQNLAFGHEGNFPVGVFFPQPVDYDTNQFTASASYMSKRWQWTAAYNLSVFTNNVAAVEVQNPFARSLGTPWPAGAFAGYPFAVGQYGLPPDSSAHRLSFNGGLTLSPKTRLRLSATYTVQKQNDEFLPYTITPQLLVPDPLPRASLNGKVHKTHIKASFSSRDVSGFDLSASYVFDDRNNTSPINVYSYIPNDAQDQVQPLIPGNSRYIRLNLPHSFKFHKIRAEAARRLSSRTRVTLTYSGDFKTRNFQQVSKTKTHAMKAKVQSSFDVGSAWLSLTYSDRNGSEYNDALPWDLSHTESYLAASPFNRSIEHPLLRKYNLADRSRFEAKSSISVSPTTHFGFTVTGGFSKDTYSNSSLGLRKAESLILSADASYVLADHVTASGFYSFEHYKSDQNGYLIFGPNRDNPDQEWRVDNKDSVHTAGITVDWQVRPDELSLGAPYQLSDGTNSTDVITQTFNILTETAPLPNAKEITHNIGLHGSYAFKPETTLRLGYTLEWHRSRDWQFDDIGFAPVPQILGSGVLPPRYTAHIGWVTVQYMF